MLLGVVPWPNTKLMEPGGLFTLMLIWLEEKSANNVTVQLLKSEPIANLLY